MTQRLSVLACACALLIGTGAHARSACIVHPGGPDTLIHATILTGDDHPRPGYVLIGANGYIDCVGAACAPHDHLPRTIDCPDDVLSPGMINPHDHIDFANAAPVADTGVRFEHRHEWRLGLDGRPRQGPSQPDHDPELIAWAELRFLVGGTTAIVGEDMAPGLARNLDFPAGMEGAPLSPVLYKVFPLDDAKGPMRTHDCDYGHHPSTAGDIAATHAFLAHVAEGTGEAARNEFRCISDAQYDTTPQSGGGGTSHDLLLPQFTILHGVGLKGDDFAAVARARDVIVWSPRSNLSLYGHTVDILAARKAGVRLALGADWLPSGSMNMNRELSCAAHYDHDHLGDMLSARDLWQMATEGSAQATHDENLLGSIAPGKLADLVLFEASGTDPYEAVVHSSPASVDMVMRGGDILVGAPEIIAGARITGCEDAILAGSDKKICIAHDQPFSYARLTQDMQARGIYPLAPIGTPPNEPPCETLGSGSAN